MRTAKTYLWILIISTVLMTMSHYSWAAIACNGIYSISISSQERLNQIHQDLVALGHEHRSFLDFVAFQENLAENTLNRRFPDWRTRERFSPKDFDPIEDHQIPGIMRILPLLVARYQVDAPSLAAHLFKRLPKFNQIMDQSDILRSISLWSVGPVGQANLLTIEENADGVQLNFLLPFAHDKEALRSQYNNRLIADMKRAEFSQTWKDGAWKADKPGVIYGGGWALKTLSKIPLKDMPTEIQSRMHNIWLKLDTYKPVVTDKVVTTNIGSCRYGECPTRFMTFMSTLIRPLNRELYPEADTELTAGALALVKVDGHILGAVKFIGDDEGYSFLAIRNVMNSEGRLVMAMGGVYALQSTFLDAALQAYEKQGKWTVIETDRFLVEPQSFFLNRSAGFEFYNRDPGNYQDPTDTEFKVGWRKFLMVLDHVRQRLENGERPLPMNGSPFGR